MLTPVILAGGNGTRLWPLSRRDTPKQFLALLGERSLLQATLLRLEGLEVTRPIVVCADAHRFLVAEQLREIHCEADIVLELEGRDTAPAISMAALCQQAREDRANRDAPLLVLPSDHHLDEVAAFHAALKTALPAAGRGDLVTFGIVPTRAETGYGYLEVADVTAGLQPLIRFVEKPDVEHACEFANGGHHLWNSGMFLLRGDRYLEELRHWRPAMHASVERAWAGRRADLDFLRPESDAFAECAAESIDYAVMEHTRAGVVIPLAAGWSDVGSYQALWDVASKDDDGNLLRRDLGSGRRRNR